LNGLPRVFLASCLLIHFQSNVFISLLFHLFFPYFNLFVSIFTHSYVHSNSVTYLDHRHSWYGITLPFFTFCFTYSFSIQFFVYFFVISSPFPLIYVNINLHLSTKIRKPRGNKKEIKNFIENKYVKQKAKKRGG
jgi:hypothetical protein